MRVCKIELFGNTFWRAVPSVCSVPKRDPSVTKLCAVTNQSLGTGGRRGTEGRASVPRVCAVPRVKPRQRQYARYRGLRLGNESLRATEG